MHYLTTRESGGNSIPTIEFTAPVPIDDGGAYYVLQNGTVVRNEDLAPVVMLPRVGSSINTALPSNNTLKPYYHQVGASSAPGSGIPATSGGKHIRIPLNTTPYVAYIHMSTGTASKIRVVVMHETTGVRVSELDYSASYLTNVEYAERSEIALAVVLTGTDKIGLLCNVTTDNGSNYVLKVIEFTFNPGTFALTATSKTNIGAGSVSFKYTFLIAGFNVSQGKVLVSNNGNYWIVNMIANTMSAVSGPASNSNQIQENKIVTFGATNQITVTDMETNGSNTFTATGSTWTGIPTYAVHLWANVYLIVEDIAASADALRIVTINPAHTSAVVTVMSCPRIEGFDRTDMVIAKARAGFSDFHMFSNARTNNFIAATFGIDSAGVVTRAWSINSSLQPGLANLVRNMSPAASGRLPYVLDQPIVCEITAAQNADTPNADAAGYIFVKYRIDVFMHLRSPKFLGNAIASYAQGTTAKLIGSPAIRNVIEPLTPWVVYHRTMKINDTQGLFFDWEPLTSGVVLDDTPSSGGSPVPIDENSFNYPLVFGGVNNQMSGTINFSIPPVVGSFTAVAVIGPFGATTIQSNGSNTPVSGKIFANTFTVLAARIVSTTLQTPVDMKISYDLERRDYV